MEICSGMYDTSSVSAKFILMHTFVLVWDPDNAGWKMPCALVGKGAMMGCGQN